MTREEQRKNKEFKIYLERKSNEYAKNYLLKKRDGRFYCSKDNMFYYMTFQIIGNRVKIDFHAKPLWIDDILWNILNMNENKKEPISLRACGAFTIYSRIEKYDYYVESTNDIDTMIHSDFEKFRKFVENFNEEDFMNEYKNIIYQSEIIQTIVLIYKQNYKEALEYLNNKSIKDFIIGDESFDALAQKHINNIEKTSEKRNNLWNYLYIFKKRD